MLLEKVFPLLIWYTGICRRIFFYFVIIFLQKLVRFLQFDERCQYATRETGTRRHTGICRSGSYVEEMPLLGGVFATEIAMAARAFQQVIPQTKE